MSLRPIAASVVFAAALLSASVIHDGGAGVIDQGTAGVGSATASPAGATASPVIGSASPGAGASPGASPAASAAPSLAPGASPGTATGGSQQPLTAATSFRVWEHGPRDAKLVALTFDDGWNLKDLGAIVAILEEKHAPGTFFPVARAVLRHPETWRGIAAAGFPIGNHSWNHDDLSKMTSAKARADLRRATATIERVTGVPLFAAVRPPFGSTDASFRKAALGAGMRAIVLWDIDTRDWTGIRPVKVLQAALKAKRGSIIVMHTDKSNTVTALPKIIDGLRADGYTLVTVGQLIGLPGPIPTFGARGVGDFQAGR